MKDTFVPKAMEMDPEDAKKLFEFGGKALLLDVPVGTEIGIDYNSWTIGDKFKGIKFIPPGLHFIYFSAVSNTTRQSAPRSGYFVWLEPAQVYVRQWHPSNEEFITVVKEQEERYRLGIKELDIYLGTYPLDKYNTWLCLTSFITREQTIKLAPKSGIVNSVLTMTEESAVKVKGQEVVEADSKFQNKEISTDSLFRFTKIPKRSVPPNCSADLITKFAMDKSWLLESLLKNDFGCDFKILLGEFQFAFVCFLIGQCFDAFEHWKNFIILICGSEEAIITANELFSEFIDVIYWQLKETPEDFFVDIVSSENFLTMKLNELYENITESNSPNSTLIGKINYLRKFMLKRFGWDIGEGLDDDLPTYVD